MVELEKNPIEFNRFVENHPLGNVHQLYEWGHFQVKTAGRDKFWPLAIKKNGQIKGTALIIRQQLPFNICWLYCPRGPLVDSSDLRGIFNQIRSIAKKENAVFLRFDPPITAHQSFKLDESRNAHAQYQPQSTLIVDLSPSEIEILKQMKPKGRYNIKVAKRHGVEIKEAPPFERQSERQGKSAEAPIDIFYNLLKQTVARDRFAGHPKQYYANMLETLGPEIAKLWIAYYKGQPLAAAIITYFKDTATYYFGASTNEHRNVMAPYLLHWEIMRDAKQNWYNKYDFFGITPPDLKGGGDGKHPWAAVSEFKLKFGGERVDYIPAQEIVYKPFWYNLIKTVKHLKGSFTKKK